MNTTPMHFRTHVRESMRDKPGVNSRFKCGLGTGFVESWIQQVTDDESVLTPNGFVGRAFGIGPIVTCSTKLGKTHLDFNTRWIQDFDVSKRVEGDG